MEMEGERYVETTSCQNRNFCRSLQVAVDKSTIFACAPEDEVKVIHDRAPILEAAITADEAL